MRVLLALAAILFALPARAELATHVEGFESATNATWSADPACRDLLVDDLVVRDGALALAASPSAVFRIAREDTGQDLCAASGWHVSGSRSDCGAALCRVIGWPEMAKRLDAALATSGSDEIHVPIHWSAPAPTRLGLAWFSCCALALVLLIVLPIARMISAGARPPNEMNWPVVIVIALVGVALRAWLARHLAFEIDEHVSQGYDSLWREFDGRETVMNPPLYRVLSWPISALTLGAPGPGRVIPVLLGFPLVLFVARLAALFGGRSAGVLAAIFAAFHPGLVLATVYHRGYAPLVVLTALSLLAVELALRSGRSIDRYFAATALGAAFLAHYFGATIVIGAVIWIVLANRSRLREWIGPAALIAVLCLPFVPAALSGAHAKAYSNISVAGATHAGLLALSLPGAILGVFRPVLETPIYLVEPHWALAIAAVAFAIIVLLGARRLAWSARVAFVETIVIATWLPAILAVRLTTVREFNAIAAAVPLIVLAAIAASAIPSRAMRCGLAVVASFCFVRLLPVAHGAWVSEPERAAEAIRSDHAHWPVFVWGRPEPGFTEVALSLGVSRAVADLTTEGHDERIQPLRSCSTAAVREAAQARADRSVRIAVLHQSCSAAELNGRGVACFGGGKSPVEMIDCTVDAQAATPVEIPSALPPKIARRADRAIPPGHEPLFMQAALPLHLGENDPHGANLARIRINMEYVEYELRPTEGPRVSVVASPRFQGDRIVGTDFTVTPPEEQLSASARDSARQLRFSIDASLTPAVWDEVYGLVTNGAGGHTPIRFGPWLWLWAAAGLVLIAQLARVHRA